MRILRRDGLAKAVDEPRLIITLSGIIGVFFLFYIRLTQVQSGLLAHDIPWIMDALAHPYAKVQVPYGILWYGINLAIPHSNGSDWTLWIALLDIPVSLVFLFKNWKLWIVYIHVSALTFTSAPYNLPILWLTGLGLFYTPLIILGPLAKLPFGPRLDYWNFIFNNSLQYADNYFFYGLLGVWWLSVLFYSQTSRISYAIRTIRGLLFGGLKPQARPGGN